MGKALKQVESSFKEIVPKEPFEYAFVDDVYAQKFASEERLATMAAFFAAIAILISCLGLLGLATYMAERRTKEIGIRKVLGASATNLWVMLSKDFVVLVTLSCIIAIPIAYIFLQSWLANYAMRISISGWVILGTGLTAILLTLITISFKALQAAFANPIKSLRSE